MRRCRRKVRWDPLKDWDGIAYHHDGVTPIDDVKANILDFEMEVFDALSRKARDKLNEDGGMALVVAGFA
jgi:hypothetical protein